MLRNLLRVTSVGKAVDATSAPNLHSWYKADALVGYNDGDGVTSLIASVGLDLPVHDITKEPVYKVAIQNGLPVVRWTTGAPGWYFQRDITDIPQPVTIYIVGKQTVASTAGRFVDNPTPRLLMGLGGTGVFEMHAGATINDAVNHSGAFHVLCGVFNGASSVGYVDGSSVVTGNPSTNGFGFPTVGSDGGIDSLVGDWCEMIVYSSAHGSTDLATINGYLKTKWGTP